MHARALSFILSISEDLKQLNTFPSSLEMHICPERWNRAGSYIAILKLTFRPARKTQIQKKRSKYVELSTWGAKLFVFSPLY